MLELIMFYMAMLCANPTFQQSGSTSSDIQISVSKDDGETGDIPPPPPIPPIPPRP